MVVRIGQFQTKLRFDRLWLCVLSQIQTVAQRILPLLPVEHGDRAFNGLRLVVLYLELESHGLSPSS